MRLHRSLITGCGAAALALGAAATAAAGATATQTPPVIHEKFTLLACPSKPMTTVQLEGCAEHKVVATDRTIDTLNAKVFAKLSKSGRTTFIQTNTNWVLYRNSACATEASIYAGGTILPVAYANCLVSIDGSHVGELKKMLVAVSPGG